MPARERWSRENPGTRLGLWCESGRGEGGEGHGFSYLQMMPAYNETGKEGHIGLTVSDFVLLIQGFMVEIHTL